MPKRQGAQLISAAQHGAPSQRGPKRCQFFVHEVPPPQSQATVKMYVLTVISNAVSLGKCLCRIPAISIPIAVTGPKPLTRIRPPLILGDSTRKSFHTLLPLRTPAATPGAIST